MRKDTAIAARCLTCGYKFDLTTAIPGQDCDTPEPGCLSICIQCADISMFDDDMGLRALTEEEKSFILSDARIVKAQQTVALIRSRMVKANA